jgi:hypothetical protein
VRPAGELLRRRLTARARNRRYWRLITTRAHTKRHTKLIYCGKR